MSITHQEARRLIQFRADDALNGNDHNLLESHLISCTECQEYAASIDDLELSLQPLLQRRWSQSPLPLSISHGSRNSVKLAHNFFFATRIIALGVICIAFLFNFWQFTQSGRQGSRPPSAEIPLIPTPSLLSTKTKLTDESCGSILYDVRQNDTLESIANQFSVTTEEILRVNQLKTASLDAGMKISLLVCNPTPSGTPHTVTTAFTPLLGSTTLTPANGPTQ